MKWVPLIGIFFIKKNEPYSSAYSYQLVCVMILWPILLYALLKILPMYDT